MTQFQDDLFENATSAGSSRIQIVDTEPSEEAVYIFMDRVAIDGIMYGHPSETTQQRRDNKNPYKVFWLLWPLHRNEDGYARGPEPICHTEQAIMIAQSYDLQPGNFIKIHNRGKTQLGSQPDKTDPWDVKVYVSPKKPCDIDYPLPAYLTSIGKIRS